MVIFEAFEDPEFSPISNPKKLSKHFVSYLKIFKPLNNPISDPQKTLFQSSKIPKTPYFRLPKPYFNPPQNPQNTLFQTFKTLYFRSPKKPANTMFQTLKTPISDLQNTMF